ncbi:MAG TPA: class I SAM-dependent DNA methyltransferase [archaeon]|nr:class I SAM-dependent DNA methyltransferase [archaeon]
MTKNDELNQVVARAAKNANFIWSIAELLRGDYKQADYGKVVLPLTVLRRLDCVLEPTKQKVLDYLPKIKGKNIQNIDPVLNKIAGLTFHNKSKFDFEKMKADHDNIAPNLKNFINGFSNNAREIIDYFGFEEHINRLDESDLLYQIIQRFAEVDLHPKTVSSIEMGYIFEELIRKFSEISNETAGEHFTPREVIRLMVNLLFIEDRDILTKEGIVKTLYDPACGTGGMLSIAEEYLRELNPDSELVVFGQELNPEAYAICKSDMMIKGQKPDNIKFGNSFTQDGLENQKFDYMLSNPPFGVDWKKIESKIKAEHEEKGFEGRFGAGLPRISDGALMFLQHMISKMKLTNGGSRLGIVFNGSPLFTGGAGSGESEIRKWIIENDMLEAIIALPNQLFYNTGIFTYIWIVTNRKPKERKGKIQLLNGISFYTQMKKSLGEKRHEISAEQIGEITKIYGNFKEGKFSKIFDNEDFGYWQITVERPARDEKGNALKDNKGKPKADSNLRDTENVSLKDDIKKYFQKEVIPHVPDAWIDEEKTKKGYEISFTKYFYEYKPLRSLEEIRKDILALEKETEEKLKEAIK